jgi:hypothetical protein
LSLTRYLAFTTELLENATLATNGSEDGSLWAPIPKQGLGTYTILKSVPMENPREAFQVHNLKISTLYGVGSE